MVFLPPHDQAQIRVQAQLEALALCGVANVVDFVKVVLVTKGWGFIFHKPCVPGRPTPCNPSWHITRHGVVVCNRRVPWAVRTTVSLHRFADAGSLSLGRQTTSHVMGAEFWSYFVPYQEDIRAVLESLREQEFRAGRFWQPSQVEPGFLGRLFGRPPSKPRPPRSIREAIKIADDSAIGTRSILDMERISETPGSGALTPVPREELRRLFGTEQPTRKMVEESEELTDKIDRGQGIYVVTYQQGRPDGTYFAGYSYD